MSEIPRYWRLRGQLLRLEGSNCPNCKLPHFPPRTVCPDCGFNNQIINQGKVEKPEEETIYQSPKKTE